MKSPVLFIIFKRESTTKRVFERIRDAQPPKLYIAADGPRASRPDEIEKCEQTRKLVEVVDWPCEVHRLYRVENLGCGKGVSSAISWFFEHEEQGIILEDDILPNLDFFTFCDEMLDRYKENDSIQLITGYNFFFDGYPSPYSYYMSRFLQIWGWASWRRVWKTYVLDTQRLDKKEYLRKLKKNYPFPTYRYYRDKFGLMEKYKNDTWDYQFFFNQVLYNRFSIIPYVNVTENIGFGSEEASHITDTQDEFIFKLINHHSHAIYPIKHPETFFHDLDADRLYAKMAQNEIPCFIYRVFRKILRIMKSFLHFL